MTADSRRVSEGDVFAAWPGATRDGRQFIGDAFARGAAAVLHEDGDGFCPPVSARPLVAVKGLRACAGELADAIYHHPSRILWLVGVTGTNGKTSISQWLAQAIQTLGGRCGVIGTLGSGFPGELAASINTTPDVCELHRELATFVRAGADAAAMEVSSIGIDQGRIDGVRFDVAIFTNLTRDHLDYHGTMEAYGAAKARLFDLPGLDTAVINADDDFGLELALKASRNMRVIAYGTSAARVAGFSGEVLLAEAVRARASGMRFTLSWAGQRREMDVRLVGHFNVSNLLATIGALLARGVALDEALRATRALTPPPGRMQLVGGESEPLVVIDYAHTPDALAKVLEAARVTARARGGRLACVFGCGGERDVGKRPQMGEIARRLADRVIVTSDNPRGENPRDIIDAILEGAGAEAEPVIERAEAIRCALARADDNDVIVLAGKGHEPYQEIGGERRPFSDLEQTGVALAARRRVTA
jgi:UDP-N-acetylmuramoyl-L-alanyl-D-glutamate--2,6-diaminopimelate ligase